MAVGAWRSRVARLPWEQEVGRSNRLAPTTLLISYARSASGRRPLVDGVGDLAGAAPDALAVRVTLRQDPRLCSSVR
jgi:hypothetical protein